MVRICFLLFTLLNLSLLAQDRPNILWITSEDNSAHYMSFMGDKNSKTPALDSLAKEGVVYTNAFANGPVCAVARSTILYGTYATSLGLQYQRSKNKVPTKFKTYVEYLRDAGYYCTNNLKTDYNSDIDHKAIWDECSKFAHYKNRKDKSKPFFAVFNNEITHESNLFAEKIALNRKRGIIPQSARVNLSDVEVPPYCPDTKKIREDIAVYYDCIEALDKFVAQKLAELKDSTEAENTIVFYYSDHGGILPREKRYINDSGTRVPLIVYFPKKWKHLAPENSRDGRLISFIDLAPTVLALANAKIPDTMSGIAFISPNNNSHHNYIFTHADRFDECNFALRRAVTDGKFRYIYNFYPQNPIILDCEYPFFQQGWQSWKSEYISGNLKGIKADYWKVPQPFEQLFEIENDKWEVADLSLNKKYDLEKVRLKNELKKHMISSRDVGIIPEPMLDERDDSLTIFEYVNHPNFDYQKVLDAAFESSSMQVFDIIKIENMLKNNLPAVRYWGLMASERFEDNLTSAVISTIKNIAENDESFTNRISACRLLAKKGIDGKWLSKLRSNFNNAKTQIQKFVLLSYIKEFDELTPCEVGAIEDAKSYLKSREIKKHLTANRSLLKKKK